MLHNGWSAVRIEIGSEACDDLCFFGYKELYAPGDRGCYPAPDESDCYRDLRVYGFIEPYLTQNDVDRVWNQIAKAAGFMSEWATVLVRNAVVQIIDGFDPAAKDRLCNKVRSQSFAFTPVIVIATDGTILCWSSNSDENEALLICQEMGIAGCRLPTGTTGDSTASSSGIPGAFPSPPATLLVPVPIPTDAACRGEICLM